MAPDRADRSLGKFHVWCTNQKHVGGGGGGPGIREDLGESGKSEMAPSRKVGEKGFDWTYAGEINGRAVAKKGDAPTHDAELTQMSEINTSPPTVDIDGKARDPTPSEHGLPNVRDFPELGSEVAYAGGRLIGLQPGVSKGTQSGYKTVWRHRSQATSNHSSGVWIEKKEPKWDERLISCALFETGTLGLQASTVRGKIAAARQWDILSGLPGFSKRSGRYKQILKSVARNTAVE